MRKVAASFSGEWMASHRDVNLIERRSSASSLIGLLPLPYLPHSRVWCYLVCSYVKHLPDEDGSLHCASLTRLCAYPHWPPHSLPRLVRRLVDRVIKTCLAVDEEGKWVLVEGVMDIERESTVNNSIRYRYRYNQKSDTKLIWPRRQWIGWLLVCGVIYIEQESSIVRSLLSTRFQ